VLPRQSNPFVNTVSVIKLLAKDIVLMLPSLGTRDSYALARTHGSVGEKRGKVREVRRFGRKRSRLDVDDVEVGGRIRWNTNRNVK